MGRPLKIKKSTTKDIVFNNICHLIDHHQKNAIPIVSKDNQLLLETPVIKKF
jgi:hypothetical protein